MEIPYTVSNRPDTGLWNAKIGIWLFLASEVMLFGALFSAYIFLRIDAAPGTWPHGLLNVPVGTMNTAILIVSSVTVVLAWAALKMRRYRAYWWYMLATITCGVIFLTVKLAYEWPQKFEHFGAYIKPDALAKYEKYLGNERRLEKGLEPRIEITGHLHAYFASYFTITGLHGLHVLGGVIVFTYMWLPVSKKLYQRNPEHLANRVEVSGLFWHFVDLVWIFVFPLFYLL